MEWFKKSVWLIALQYLFSCISRTSVLPISWISPAYSSIIVIFWLNDYEVSAVSEHDGRVFFWLCQLEIISCFFSRKSYFFFYKLNKQVTNNVFKKRKTKGNGGRRFWGFCTPSVEFNKWRPERNERNSSQDSKRHSLVLSKLPKCFISRWTHSWLFYNIFNPIVCWFDLFADVMSVHNRNMKHAILLKGNFRVEKFVIRNIAQIVYFHVIPRHCWS